MSSNYFVEEETENKSYEAYRKKPDKCPYCTDKRGNIKEIFWMPETGGMRQCNFCPECGNNIK